MLTGKVLRLISRDEWLAQPPNEVLTPLILPAKRIIITHTATEFCETQVSLFNIYNQVQLILLKVNSNIYLILGLMYIKSSTYANISYGVKRLG